MVKNALKKQRTVHELIITKIAKYVITEHKQFENGASSADVISEHYTHKQARRVAKRLSKKNTKIVDGAV